MKENNTERKILKASLELFVRKGYHGTSIGDIMSKVGMTKGAFYSHFDSKGSLFLKLISDYRTLFLNEIFAATNSGGGNALDKIHRVFSSLAKFAVENTDLCVFLTFLTTEMKADVDFEPVLRSVYVDYQKFIAELIRQGIKQGIIKKELDPDLAALTFMALHDGTLHQWVLGRQYIDGEAYVRTFRNIFVNGVSCQNG